MWPDGTELRTLPLRNFKPLPAGADGGSDDRQISNETLSGVPGTLPKPWTVEEDLCRSALKIGIVGVAYGAAGRLIPGEIMFQWVAFAFFLLPALAVKTAPTTHRISWVVAVLFIFLFLAALKKFIIFVNPEMANRGPIGPYTQHQGKTFNLTVIPLLVTAEFLAIMFTYGHPNDGFIGDLAGFIATIGAALIPAISKYATSLEPPLATELVLKVQATFTVISLALALTTIVLLVYTVKMPVDEKVEILKIQGATKLKTMIALLGCPIFIVIGLVSYFGWLDFAHGSSYREHHDFFDCLMEPQCFPNKGDVAILLAAGLKAMMMFVFPLGVVMIIDMARLRRFMA